ncbi:hypothetical protein EVAR_51268_1 [Eumeta japonica]|uniref:Uncharacterized protein n=1 Tax=Eumeta variegata TaxID=151549 RepID=A0A4C1YBK6_EUMVA|nr:hypothetical protein EVAR_51268_1 [Eumeta japonica]
MEKSIEEELEAHRRNGTWILVNKPENTNIIGSKWYSESKISQRVHASSPDSVQRVMPKQSVPVDPHSRLEKSVQLPDKNLPYRAVGSLMHVAIVSRPDVMFAVNLIYLACADDTFSSIACRYRSSPKIVLGTADAVDRTIPPFHCSLSSVVPAEPTCAWGLTALKESYWDRIKSPLLRDDKFPSVEIENPKKYLARRRKRTYALRTPCPAPHTNT